MCASIAIDLWCKLKLRCAIISFSYSVGKVLVKMNKVSLLLLLSFAFYVGGVNLDEFYPHGDNVGDLILHDNDDSSTTPINLTVPFPFFDRDRDVIFVSMHLAPSLRYTCST